MLSRHLTVVSAANVQRQKRAPIQCCCGSHRLLIAVINSQVGLIILIKSATKEEQHNRQRIIHGA